MLVAPRVSLASRRRSAAAPTFAGLLDALELAVDVESSLGSRVHSQLNRQVWIAADGARHNAEHHRQQKCVDNGGKQKFRSRSTGLKAILVSYIKTLYRLQATLHCGNMVAI